MIFWNYITKEWPLVRGKASMKAKDFSVSPIIFAGISRFTILQNIQSIFLIIKKHH